MGDLPARPWRVLEFLKCGMAAFQGDLLRERFAMPRLPSAGARTWPVWCLAELEEFVPKQGVDQAVAMGSRLGHSLSIAWLAETHLSTRRTDHALELTQHALESSRSRREGGAKRESSGCSATSPHIATPLARLSQNSHAHGR
jgi:hypothetical protein